MLIISAEKKVTPAQINDMIETGNFTVFSYNVSTFSFSAWCADVASMSNDRLIKSNSYR